MAAYKSNPTSHFQKLSLSLSYLTMGCSLSCPCNSSQTFNCARVIQINGYIQDFICPVTVSQVTGKPPNKHVLFTSAQLLSFSTRPLRPEDSLESGRIYFLLPYSVFQSDSSPLDLASLVTRLTAVAKRAPPADPVKPGPLSDCGSGLGLARGNMVGSLARTWEPVLETIGEVSFRGLESSFGSRRSSIGSMREIVE